MAPCFRPAASSVGQRFRQACELVRNGRIGKLQRVDTYIGDIDGGTWQPTTTPPPELDWNFWLGPAPWADYSANRCHYQFRWFQRLFGRQDDRLGRPPQRHRPMGHGHRRQRPGESFGPRRMFHENGPHDVAGKFDVKYTYANGVEMTCHSDGWKKAALSSPAATAGSSSAAARSRVFAP